MKFRLHSDHNNAVIRDFVLICRDHEVIIATANGVEVAKLSLEAMIDGDTNLPGGGAWLSFRGRTGGLGIQAYIGAADVNASD